jgi:hypothetical protein
MAATTGVGFGGSETNTIRDFDQLILLSNI